MKTGLTSQETADGQLVLKPVLPFSFACRTLHWTKDRQAMADLNLGPRKTGLLRWWRWLRKTSRNNRACSAIWLEGLGRPVGICMVSFHPAANDASAQVCIGEADFRSGDFAGKAMDAVLSDIFDRRGINKVTNWISASNAAAAERAMCSGFTREAVLRHSAIDSEGAKTDKVAFGMLRSEWLERRAAYRESGRVAVESA